jgi:hypothetical protein
MSNGDSNPISYERAQNAFRLARGKAFLRNVWAALQGRSNQLLPYEEVRQKVRAGGPVYRGLHAVSIRQIVGSVNRYRDFDRAFLPSQDATEARWESIGRAYYDQVNLPPVKLYKVGDAYFVVDGNHRVSVARELGREFIDAEVQECRVSVPITPDIEADDLEVIGERAEFVERTRLAETRPDVEIAPTIPGGYDLLLEHVEVHRYLQSQEWTREFSFDEAAAQWVDQVYLPIVKVVRETGILDEFPGRSEADLYLWLMEHLYFLRQRFGGRVDVQAAARSFARHFTERTLKRFWHWLSYHALGQAHAEESGSVPTEQAGDR